MLTYRITGFILSFIFTLGAYFIIVTPAFFHLDVDGAVLAIFILAFLQFTVQFVCFINLWREKKPFWNLGVFLSTLSIIFIVIVGSLWIMYHLNYNMMPQH